MREKEFEWRTPEDMISTAGYNMGPKNESMPEKLKDKTECGLYWSIARCMFGKDWNQTKEEMLPSDE